ncbi:hypothetical protein PQD71_gp159 [Kosakonia phage Kc263]|uniref:Uncharacterized protein n=1 Tax=Kosakonia phage Kc263 TaxID=2863194 RepID=A0AAE7WFX4_9CAUD|nr:hypothetical protein PQD71_gp159 [Kosakonia phage Kc263]QYN80052.1 hypothetical protein [Kosakonia phage Kc263]
MSTFVRLNSDLINQIRSAFISLAEQAKVMKGSDIVEQELLPGIRITCRSSDYNNSVWFKLDDDVVPLEPYELDNPDLGNKVIAVTLTKLIHKRLGLENGITDMLAGFSIWTNFESPFGIEIKYHRDLDSQVLLVQEIGNPNRPVYALEEAVNTELSISFENTTPASVLENRIWHLLGDYILADLASGRVVSLGEYSGATEEAQGEGV